MGLASDGSDSYWTRKQGTVAVTEDSLREHDTAFMDITPGTLKSEKTTHWRIPGGIGMV
jgi:hypothetical protein